jgi:hypothetical protein
VDDDRATEVDREVAELLGGAHDAEDVGLLGPVHLEGRGIVVREQHLVVAVKLPRHGHRHRERWIVDGMQPVEHRPLVAREQGVAGPAEANQAVGELDHRVVADLDAPKARAVDVHVLEPPELKGTSC